MGRYRSRGVLTDIDSGRDIRGIELQNKTCFSRVVDTRRLGPRYALDQFLVPVPTPLANGPVWNWPHGTRKFVWIMGKMQVV